MEKALQEVGDLSDWVVLDAGTGAGGTTSLLARKVGNGIVVSVDLWDEAIQFAKKRLKKDGLYGNVQIVKGNLADLSFIIDNSIDLIAAGQTICAIDESILFGTINALKEFFRVLESGGFLVIQEDFPHEAPSNKAEEVAETTWRIHKAVFELLGEGHYLEFPPEWLADRLRDIGFTKVKWWKAYDRSGPSDEAYSMLKTLSKYIKKIKDRGLREAFMKKVEELKGEYKIYGATTWSAGYVLTATKP